MSNLIHTINAENEAELKEKGSLFVAKCKPIETTAEAKIFLEQIKKKYYDATHHCYAVKLHDGTVQHSDDGEPNGSAGIRIVNAIDHFKLTNIIVVVIRYFGGTKLGVGPLGKAYYSVAELVLAKSKIVELNNFSRVEISVPVELTGALFHQIELHKAKVEKKEFNDQLSIILLIKSELVEIIKNELTESTRGKLSFKLLEEDIFRMKF